MNNIEEHVDAFSEGHFGELDEWLRSSDRELWGGNQLWDWVEINFMDVRIVKSNVQKQLSDDDWKRKLSNLAPYDCELQEYHEIEETPENEIEEYDDEFERVFWDNYDYNANKNIFWDEVLKNLQRIKKELRELKKS